MDRDALARAARRRLALDALAFERDREALLREGLEDAVASVDGPQVDAEVYARLDPDDLQRVRAAFGDSIANEFEDDEADEEDAESDLDPLAEAEEEIARLVDELEQSARIQGALQRYLDALAATPDDVSVEQGA